MARLSMSAALDVWRDAVRDLGADLGGMTLEALLYDNFPEESLATCDRVAAQLRKDLPRGPLPYGGGIRG